jgi:hypothetical protein
MSQWFRRCGQVVAVAIVLVGVSEVVQAASARDPGNCPDLGNWCAPSRGGETNCRLCCQAEASICISDHEDGDPISQGCVCA